MNSISFTIEGEVKGKMRPKATAFGGHARVYTPSAQIKNENWIKLEYQMQAEALGFNGFGDLPLAMYIIHHMAVPSSFSKKKRQLALEHKIFPTKKPDVDNLAKTVLDALNGVAFSDDKNIIDLHIIKDYSEKNSTTVVLSEYIGCSLFDGGVNALENIRAEDNELCLD